MSDTFVNGSVELVINGESKGNFPATGTIGDFVRANSTRYGLKAFSVYVNGTKFFTEQANQPIPDGSKIELIAKDSRGSLRRFHGRVND